MAVDTVDRLATAERELRATYGSDAKKGPWVDYMIGEAHSHRQRLEYMADLLSQETGRLLDVGANIALVHMYLASSSLKAELTNNGGETDGSAWRDSWQVCGNNVPAAYFDIERHQAPYEAERFDGVLFLEILEHMSTDPMAAMQEINRVTATGGFLYLSTPNITSYRSIHRAIDGGNPYLSHEFQRKPSTDRHNREYTPREIDELLRCAGFELNRLQTPSFYSELSDYQKLASAIAQLPGSDELRGDTILARATKVSDVVERYRRSCTSRQASGLFRCCSPANDLDVLFEFADRR